MGLRLLHLADTHIGVETYGRVDPTTGRHSRLNDFAASLNRAVEIGLDHHVDAVLFAGDAYRTCYPSPTHQQVFAEAIGRFGQAGVPVVMVAGNHDLPVAFGRTNALEIFRALASDRFQVTARPELRRLETASGPLQVACLPWPLVSLLRSTEGHQDLADEALRERLGRLLEGAVDNLAGQAEPAVPTVLLGHITAADAVFSGSEKAALVSGDPTLSRGVLADQRFDYVALGHLHRHQSLNGEARPPVVYSGSIDRLDFGERQDVKGVCVVSIGDGPTPAARQTTWEHIPLPVRAFVEQTVAVPAEADATAWLVDQIRGWTLDEAIFRLRYTCTDEQYASLDLSAIRQAAGAAFLITGLVRERPKTENRPQVEITEHLGLAEALDRYLDTRSELAPLREAIHAAGLALDQELARRDSGAPEETSR